MKTEQIKIIKLDTITSTNDYLKQLAKSGCPEKTVVIADCQTSGKGTKNRSFISQKGGVYLSILIRPKVQGFDATLITSATAVAVSDAINKISGKETQIKWVNDIYLENKKVCGILCESVFNADGKIPYIIVGIGVNLFKPQNDFPNEIKDIATYIFEKEDINIKEKFISILLDYFFKFIDDLENKTFLQKYREKNLVLGKEICVTCGDDKKIARAIDIDDQCRLLIEFPNKVKKTLCSGEVTIKI